MKLRDLRRRLDAIGSNRRPLVLTSHERRRRLAELTALARARLAAGAPRQPTDPVLLARFRELRAKVVAWGARS